MICPSIVIDGPALVGCVIKTGSYDDKEFIKGNMRPSVIFVDGTFFLVLWMTAVEVTTPIVVEPLWNETLCYEQCSAVLKAALDLSINESLKACLLESFAH